MNTQEAIYNLIEEKVKQQLENGIIPWRRCYHTAYGDHCVSHQSKRLYSLLNQIILDMPGEYWTFDQARREGYRIRKGSKSVKVIFWKILHYEDKKRGNEDDEVRYKTIPYLKYYPVFHESDVEGLPEKKIEGLEDMTPEERELKNAQKIEKAETIVNDYLTRDTALKINTSDRIPMYRGSEHQIYIPEKSHFDSIFEYYSTLFHEMIHSTKEALGRPQHVHGDIKGRAREELVAEIGAAMLCGYAGIDQEDVISNNSSYCTSWLQALNGNIQNLVWAASRAEQAAKHIMGITEDEDKETT